VVLASPWLLGFAESRAAGVHVTAGLVILLAAVMTDFEFGIFRVIPMPVHLMLDGVIGVVAAASPWLVGYENYAALPVILGVLEIGAALMTSTQPANRTVRA
jgi:hypothetical protein